jgi:hypothetical protein
MQISVPLLVYGCTRVPDGDDAIVRRMEAQSPSLLDRVREATRMRQYSRRTEEAYVAWIRPVHPVSRQAACGARSIDSR